MTPKFIGYQRNITTQKKTFVGTLVSGWQKIAETNGWNEQTQHQYISDYTNHILPYIPQNKALQDLTLEDIELPLTKTSEYAENTVRHYKHLILVVLKVGLTKDAYDELILGSALDLKVPQDAIRRARFYQVRKSLTIPQRIFLLKYFAEEPNSLSGEEVGLFLMYMCGLRNNEACALDYGDLRSIPESDRKCLWVYKSTSEKSSKIKASGKTSNANRYLPVSTLVVKFIERRRDYLQDLIDNGLFEAGVRSAEELPIVCHGKKFSSRCQADDLGRAAKKLFRNLPGFDMQILSILDEEAHQIDSEEQKDVAEKSPTAYLFRHDYATTVHCLGLTEAEIEYCIGHQMERTDSSRNDFSSADVLKKISEKVEFQPVNRLFFDSVPQFSVNKSVPSACAEGAKISASLGAGEYHIEVIAKEPNESIQMSANSSVPITVISNYGECQYEKIVDAKDEVFTAYQREARKQGLVRPAWL